ncbi:MAG TPA: hypothetical protein VG815_16945 [Chloroflexota bacterium]|jgi:hypothetical protein|nr:hypothetical protein [Chloroflexota bacterium]
MSIVVRILSILLAIAFVVLAYYVVIWVLGMLGVHIPAQILTVVFVIIGLMMAIGILSGQFDRINWWGGPVP